MNEQSHSTRPSTSRQMTMPEAFGQARSRRDLSHYRVFSTAFFRDAPVSKLWLATNVVAGVTAFGLTNIARQQYAAVAFPRLSKADDFVTIGQSLLCGAVSKWTLVEPRSLGITLLFLVHASRQVERALGSRKFTSFMFLTTICTTLIEFAIGTAAPDVVRIFNPGCRALIAANIYLLCTIAPKTQFADFFSFAMPSTLVYALFLLSGTFMTNSTMVSTAAGLLFGCAYSNDLLHMQSFRLPSFLFDNPLVNWTSHFWHKAFEPSHYRRLPMAATAQLQAIERADELERQLMQMAMRQAMNAGDGVIRSFRVLFNSINTQTGMQQINQPIHVDPSPQNIAMLVNMGFTDVERVRRALQQSSDNVNDAASLLLANAPL